MSLNYPPPPHRRVLPVNELDRSIWKKSLFSENQLKILIILAAVVHRYIEAIWVSLPIACRYELWKIVFYWQLQSRIPDNIENILLVMSAGEIDDLVK